MLDLPIRLCAILALLVSASTTFGQQPPGFSLVKEYSGKTFFDDWDFYNNWDDLTHGNVSYVSQANGGSLAFVNDAGHAIIKVDNTTSLSKGDIRNSVRITTHDYFEIGTIWVIDAIHLPFGCSVWPSIWTKGDDWPNMGEIDIVEGINLDTDNQMAIHTRQGCMASKTTDETGVPGILDCSIINGCTVREDRNSSYGAAFAKANGGVFVTQFDISGIYIWYWDRAVLPDALKTAPQSLDATILASFGPPSAAYPSGNDCDIGNFFGAQQLVIDITLCGDWAGVPSLYQQTCPADSGNPQACYLDNVVGDGSNYKDAYFEISYIRAFSASPQTVITPSPSGPPAAPSPAPSSDTGGDFPGSDGSNGSGGVITGGATSMTHPSVWLLVGVSTIFCMLFL